jgi:hypothetical protein
LLGSLVQVRRPKTPLSAQPVGYFLTRAAELRTMAATARDTPTLAALIRLAERFEAIAAKRLGLPDDTGGS